MTTPSKLTEEQINKIFEYDDLLLVSKANIDNAIKSFTELEEKFNVVNTYIPNYTTSDIFKEINGTNTLKEQEYIIENISPFYVFPDEVKKAYTEKIFPSLEKEYKGSKFKVKEHSFTYMTSVSNNSPYFDSENESYIKSYLLKIKEELEDFKDPNIIKTNSEYILDNLFNVASDLLFASKVFNTLRALGGKRYSADYNEIQKLPNFNANGSFLSELVTLDNTEVYTKITAPLEQIKELQNYTKEDLKEIEGFRIIKLIEEKNLLEANPVKSSINNAVTNLDKYEEGTLQQYIQSIINNEDEEFNEVTASPFEHLLINEDSLTDITNTFDNIFEYLFTIDDRLLTLYNSEKYLKREESEIENIPRPNFNSYRNDYYNNWFSDLDKLKGTNSSTVNIKAQVEELKTVITTETLNDSEIEDINTRIDNILTTVLMEVEPNIYSFYKVLTMFTDKLKDEESAQIFYESLQIKLTPPINLSNINLVYLTQIANRVRTEVLTYIDSIVTSLVKLKQDLIKQTKLDLLNIVNPESIFTIEEIITRAKEYKTGLNTLHKGWNEIVNSGTDENTILKYFNTLELPGDNVYNKLEATRNFKTKFRKLRASKPHNYEPLSQIFVEDLSEELNKLRPFASSNDNKTFQIPGLDSPDLLPKLENIKNSLKESDADAFNTNKTNVLRVIVDNHDVLLTYFLAVEVFNITNTAPRLKSNNNLYLKESNDFKYEAIQSLKFNSKKLYETAIKLHKAITDLTFTSKEVLEEIKELEEEETFSDIKEKVAIQNEEALKTEALPDLPKENWGVRISPANAFTRTVIQSTAPPPEETDKELTEEEKTNLPEISTVESTKFGKSWYMMLLPTMTSNLPVTGGSQAPGVQPGLNFRIVNSLVKHKIPGFGPVYQPMGIDTINCTIVGCFTGADGTNKYRVGSVENFSEGGFNASKDLFGLNGEIGNNGAGFLQKAVNRFDSFENFQGFYNEIIRTNKEIEVEINLKKSTNVIANGAEGIFRDATTGNPKFKGFIKRFDTYYVREDRTWYILDIQLTTNDLTSKKCVNLTNIISESTPEFSIEELRTKDFEDIRKCVFHDTPGLEKDSGVPPLYNGKLFEIRDFSSFLKSFSGITLKARANDKEHLAISKHGYGIRYSFSNTNQGLNYELIGTNPLSPLQVFREMGRTKYWKIDERIAYSIAYNTIQGFNSQSSDTENKQLVGPELRVTKNSLPKPVIFDGEGRGVWQTVNVNTIGYIPLQYNYRTGNMSEVARSKRDAEYPVMEVLKGVKDFKETKKYLEFVLELEKLGANYIDFKLDQKTEECLEEPPEGTTNTPITNTEGESLDLITALELEELIKNKLTGNSIIRKKKGERLNTIYVEALLDQKLDERYINRYIKLNSYQVIGGTDTKLYLDVQVKNTDPDYKKERPLIFYYNNNRAQNGSQVKNYFATNFSVFATSVVRVTLSINKEKKEYSIINIGPTKEQLSKIRSRKVGFEETIERYADAKFPILNTNYIEQANPSLDPPE